MYGQRRFFSAFTDQLEGIPETLHILLSGYFCEEMSCSASNPKL